MPAAATERAREAALGAMQKTSAFARLVPAVDVDGAEEQAAHATFGPLLTVLSGGPVDLPTVTVEGRPVRIEPVAAQSRDGR
jgi:hypothetical protein